MTTANNKKKKIFLSSSSKTNYIPVKERVPELGERTELLFRIHD